MAGNRGMGRGLAAILPESGVGEPAYREIPVGMIQPNPEQPRKRFDSESKRFLGRSGFDHDVADAVAVPALIRDDDEVQRLQTALIENVAREDLNPVEEARACAALVEELGLSKEELGRRVGRSRSAISNLVRILDLPDEALA